MQPHSDKLRANRYSASGMVYLITTATDLRRKLFLDSALATIVSDSFRYFDEHRIVHSFAWVVMPDHIHWVFQLKQHELRVVLRRMKNWTGREINRHSQTKGRGVWQRGFHDKCLTRTTQIDNAIRYVVYNPVVAGLVRTPGDYRFTHIGERYPAWDGEFFEDRQSQIGSHT